VEGVERQVFDIGRALPFGVSTEGSDFDMVESFYVNVPNTNVDYTLVRHVRTKPLVSTNRRQDNVEPNTGLRRSGKR
jgi:hypothetical protein